MRVDSTFKRVLAMIAIGFALVLIQYLITGRASGVITGGILYFVWQWLGGKWSKEYICCNLLDVSAMYLER